jgi:hypothetical protein
MNDAEFADALGYEHVAIRQKGQTPGVVQAACESGDLDLHGTSFGRFTLRLAMSFGRERGAGEEDGWREKQGGVEIFAGRHGY